MNKKILIDTKKPSLFTSVFKLGFFAFNLFNNLAENELLLDNFIMSGDV